MSVISKEDATDLIDLLGGYVTKTDGNTFICGIDEFADDVLALLGIDCDTVSDKNKPYRPSVKEMTVRVEDIAEDFGLVITLANDNTFLSTDEDYTSIGDEYERRYGRDEERDWDRDIVWYIDDEYFACPRCDKVRDKIDGVYFCQDDAALCNDCLEIGDVERYISEGGTYAAVSVTNLLRKSENWIECPMLDKTSAQAIMDVHPMAIVEEDQNEAALWLKIPALNTPISTSKGGEFRADTLCKE